MAAATSSWESGLHLGAEAGMSRFTSTAAPPGTGLLWTVTGDCPLLHDQCHFQQHNGIPSSTLPAWQHTSARRADASSDEILAVHDLHSCTAMQYKQMHSPLLLLFCLFFKWKRNLLFWATEKCYTGSLCDRPKTMPQGKWCHCMTVFKQSTAKTCSKCLGTSRGAKTET